ncbi:MAG: hypothetical protein ACLVEJ_02200 [Parabacteroides sp.]
MRNGNPSRSDTDWQDEKLPDTAVSRHASDKHTARPAKNSSCGCFHRLLPTSRVIVNNALKHNKRLNAEGRLRCQSDSWLSTAR